MEMFAPVRSLSLAANFTFKARQTPYKVQVVSEATDSTGFDKWQVIPLDINNDSSNIEKKLK